MVLNELSLTGFRNYGDTRFVFGPEGAFFHGHNGAGKTNILEAVYTLAFARSFRTRKTEDLISWDSEEAVVSAIFTDGTGLGNEITLRIGKKKRPAL